MVSHEIIDAYRQARGSHTNTRVLCHAPFVSMNFAQDGRVTSCCYNRRVVLGAYPEQSVAQIWNGASAREFRDVFLHEQPAAGCDICFHQLAARNFEGALMRKFDYFVTDAAYQPATTLAAPRLLEFELSSTCNLECTMCMGYLSSAIRARRELLPPLKNPYDLAFVAQVEPFLRAATAANFLGGEPFLIDIYYALWDAIRRVHPELRIAITTNATVLSDRARHLLHELRAGIVVSLDALTPSIYEQIRKNARFSQVMANVEYLLAYTRARGTHFSVAVCPMTYNWRELPALLDFCQERAVPMHFNTVLLPVEASLRALAADDLAGVIAYLEPRRPVGDHPWTRTNAAEWDGLLNQLRGWHHGKQVSARRRDGIAGRARRFAASHERVAPVASRRLQTLASRFVDSLSEARERAGRQHATFPIGIPRRTATAPVAMTGSDVVDLAGAIHLMWHYLNRDTRARRPDSLAGEQHRLQQFLAQQPGRLAAIGAWIEYRVQSGQAHLLMSWMREVIEALTNEGMTSRLDEIRATKADGLRQLAERGVDAGGCSQVAAYFDGLMYGVLGPAAAEPPDGCRDGAALLPAGSREDLCRLGDALCLFDRALGRHRNDAEFRDRVKQLLAAVERAKHRELVLRILQWADAGAVYAFVAKTPRHRLEDHLTSWLEQSFFFNPRAGRVVH